MDQYELLGFLLQHLRDNREADEEDMDPSILRETTKIYGLIIHHGRLSRDMFDLSGITDRRGRNTIPKRYRSYQTTNYPANFVCFADAFADWLKGEAEPSSLGVLDVIEMIQEWSLIDIEVRRRTDRALVIAHLPALGESQTFRPVSVRIDS